MTNRGFRYAELEGMGEENLKEAYWNRERIKSYCKNLGVKMAHSCPLIPDIVSLDDDKRGKAKDLFMIVIELSTYFNCYTIQTGRYTPPLEFMGEFPHKESISYGKQYRIKVDLDFS